MLEMIINNKYIIIEGRSHGGVNKRRRKIPEIPHKIIFHLCLCQQRQTFHLFLNHAPRLADFSLQI